MTEEGTERPEYMKKVISADNKLKNFGRMNAPIASAFINGACGDDMEFYLDIADGVIEKIKFHTNGCMVTMACGSMTAQLSEGKNIEDAMHISAGEVIDNLGGLPEDHHHCAILAVSTFYKALADYLLQP
ncbi:MAG: iron-sulfur cluster assembly scaffold protein [Nitrospinota bacterium]